MKNSILTSYQRPFARWTFFTLMLWALSGKSALATDCTPYINPAEAGSANVPSFNKRVLQVVASMPHGGNHSTDAATQEYLRHAISFDENTHELKINVTGTLNSNMCSSATYLVLLKTLAPLKSKISSGAPSASELMALKNFVPQDGQSDGIGPWGWWNANGPGTARFFKSTGLGRNFTDYSQARPGDFMKIWWNEHIGAKERGHSVVFLGCQSHKEIEFVCFWSSNVAAAKSKSRSTNGPDYYPEADNSWLGGYTTRCVPRTDVKRQIFSRLERSPQKLPIIGEKERNEDLVNFERTKNLSQKEADDYLSELSR